jgi:hypothetical protein
LRGVRAEVGEENPREEITSQENKEAITVAATL